MKFVIAAVVVFAFVIGAQSSILPLGIPGLIAPHGIATSVIAGPTLLTSPAIIPHSPAIALAHGPAGHIVSPATIAVHSAPIVHAAPIIAAEGQYVAKTRGAVHTAPLAGHINSAASINLEPAPGTI